MSRSILIVHPDLETIAEMADIFEDQGNEVNSASTLKDAGEQMKYALPDVLILDISLLGKKWPAVLPQVVERFQQTQVIFTCLGTDPPPKSAYDELVEWKILTGPITLPRLQLALAGELSRYDILEPLQKKPLRALPIRLQISWPYLLLTLFFSLAAAYITTRIVFDSAEERFSNQLVEVGKLSSEWMVLEEENLLESLRLVANTSGMFETVQSKNIDQIHQIVYPLAVNSGVADIQIITPDGTTLYSLRHRTGSTIEDYLTATGGSEFKDASIVQAILDNQSDDFGDKHAGALQPSWGGTFYISGPIQRNGELAGVIMVGKPLALMTQDLRQTTLAQTTLYDQNGNVLATTFISPENLDVSQAAAALFNQDTESQVRYRRVADIAYTEILAPWEVRNDLDIGIIGAALPQTYLVQTNTVTRAQILAALAVFIALVVYTGFRLANRISKPLESLSRASEEVAQGNFLITLESPGSKEVAVLNQTFNTMIQSLKNSRAELFSAYEHSLEGWSRALSLRDHDTDEHSKRVVELSVQMAQALGLDSQQIENIRRGAILHDIGKMGIPDHILNKNGPLSEEEWRLMRKHPQMAVDMLKPVSFLTHALEIPLYHHEKWDGSGYPYGLIGDQIPLAARIFAVADVFDALCSNRPYRDAWSKQEAVRYLIKNKEKHFDPEIVDLFLTKVLGLSLG